MVTTGSQLTLLIVDDQPSFRKTMRDMLRRAGFSKIVTADDGDTALQILRARPIDLVLADWNMPRMSGVELLRVVRDDPVLREMPFIMITGESEHGTVAEAIEDEVDAYLLKPLSVDVLREKIWRIFDRLERPPALDTHLQLGQACALPVLLGGNPGGLVVD
ncbi:MAG: response regulator [Proteobacteria bacterium]|nr:response regulator [Pseudomonadota bacterium]